MYTIVYIKHTELHMICTTVIAMQYDVTSVNDIHMRMRCIQGKM